MVDVDIFVWSVLLPQIANECGWFTAEIGRQPWVVYGLLKTSDALSRTVTANQVVFSLLLFALVYALTTNIVFIPAEQEDTARAGNNCR